MQKKTKTFISIAALAMAILLLICGVIAGMVVIPQTREKGKRYQETTRFVNRNEKIQMIAHRGLSGLALENTTAAFIQAGHHNYYGIETDVLITKDGQFILCHDNTLSRIAGVDILVEQTDFATLRALRFPNSYTHSDEKNHALASVDEYLSICKEYGKHAVLELKSTFSAEKITELVELIKAFEYLDCTTFISFSQSNLLALRAQYPSVSAQYIVQNCTQEDERFMIENKLDADLCWVSVTRSRVRRLKRAGLKINCWTVDGAACATLMQDYGVDQITTNILE